jgi:hypothetical protein
MFNGLMNDERKKFILQNTNQLFFKLGYLKNISDTITDTAATVDKLFIGGNISNDNSMIQSILFDKNKYNINECNEFLKKYKYKNNKNDITNNYYRYHQYNPIYLKKLGYNDYMIKTIKPGLKILLVYK